MQAFGGRQTILIHRRTVNCILMAVMVLAAFGVAVALDTSTAKEMPVIVNSTILASFGVDVASDTTTTKEKSMIANSTILLFDASDSMGNVSSSIGNASSRASTNRKIDNAKTAVKTFISGLDPATDEVALIVFYDCGKIVIEQPFTTDQAKISSRIDGIKPAGYTPLSAAIDYAENYLNQSTDGSMKKIILFTDGEETCPYKAISKGKDIELSIIGFDIPKGSTKEAKLQEFAKKVGGTYLSAEDATNPTALTKGLQQAYAGVSTLNNALVWVSMGIDLVKLNKYDEAIKAFDEALDLDPMSATAWSGKGTALQKLGKDDEAITAFDKALDLDPMSATAWSGKGYVLQKLGKDDEAITAFDKALDLDPMSATAWSGKGYILQKLGKDDEAVQAYDKAFQLDPASISATTWSNKGAAYLNLSKYDEAIQALDKANELDPEYARAWYNKGAVYLKLGKYDEAIQVLDKALDLDPKDSSAWYAKGRALDALDKYDEAIQAYDEALKLNPNMAKS
ncbi:MAG: tetratricopeptide repeat protein [Methanotrichaceae archaeon]|nr:tetratricopeptide repeat protein [Methanotrichaceae archaeon]